MAGHARCASEDQGSNLKHPIAFLLAAAVFLAPLALNADYKYSGWENGPWELHDMQYGIKVYINEKAPADVAAFRADAVIDLPADKIFPILIDHERARKNPVMDAYKVLKTENGRTLIYQRVKDSIVNPRDYILWTRSFKPEKPNTGRYGFVWESAKKGEGPAPKDEYVRVTNVKGSFILTPIDGGKRTRVSYRSLFDPGAFAPTMLVNSALSDATVDFVERLRKDAERLK